MKTQIVCVAAAMFLAVAPTTADNTSLARTAWIQQSLSLERDGAVALKAGDLPTAETDYRASIAAMGNAFGPGGAMIWDANYGLAEVLTDEGRVTEAIQVYRQALLPPRTDGRGEGGIVDAARLRYVILLDQTGQWAEAVQNYEAVLAAMNAPLERSNDPTVNVHFDSAQPDPSELAAMTHILLGLHEYSEPNKALNDFGKALQLAPDSDLTNYYYGYGLQRAGKTAQASIAFQKTIKMAYGGVKLAAVKALKKLKAKPA